MVVVVARVCGCVAAGGSKTGSDLHSLQRVLAKTLTQYMHSCLRACCVGWHRSCLQSYLEAPLLGSKASTAWSRSEVPTLSRSSPIHAPCSLHNQLLIRIAF